MVLEPRDYRKDASTERKALKAQRLVRACGMGTCPHAYSLLCFLACLEVRKQESFSMESTLQTSRRLGIVEGECTQNSSILMTLSNIPLRLCNKYLGHHHRIVKQYRPIY